MLQSSCLPGRQPSEWRLDEGERTCFPEGSCTCMVNWCWFLAASLRFSPHGSFPTAAWLSLLHRGWLPSAQAFQQSKAEATGPFMNSRRKSHSHPCHPVYHTEQPWFSVGGEYARGWIPGGEILRSCLGGGLPHNIRVPSVVQYETLLLPPEQQAFLFSNNCRWACIWFVDLSDLL